jgi:hypothetical protein
MYEDHGRQLLSHHAVGAPSSYVPTLNEMRKDNRLVAEAEERCGEIDASHLGNCHYTSSKKAWGLLRAGVEASKHVHIEWPHDHILVGPDKDRVFYKNLNMEQWAYGYTCIMENQSNYKVKDNMITHLKHVFQDSMSYGFRRAKGAHAEVLNEMELGKINWLDAHAISELRKTHTQKQMTMEEWQEKMAETKTQEMRESGQGQAARREGRTRRVSNEHSGKRHSIVYVVTTMMTNAYTRETISKEILSGDMHVPAVS